MRLDRDDEVDKQILYAKVDDTSSLTKENLEYGFVYFRHDMYMKEFIFVI